MGDIFLAHFGPLVPIEHCLNATANLSIVDLINIANLSIVADHVHHFMTTVDGYFQQDNAPCPSC